MKIKCFEFRINDYQEEFWQELMIIKNTFSQVRTVLYCGRDFQREVVQLMHSSTTSLIPTLVIYFCVHCLYICLNPINVKTAEPIGPKFCVGPHMTPGKVLLSFKYWPPKNQFSLNFENSQFFIKYSNFSVFVLQCIQIKSLEYENLACCLSVFL